MRRKESPILDPPESEMGNGKMMRIIETPTVTTLVNLLRSGVAQCYDDETVPCYSSLHTSIALLFRERKGNYNSNHH